MKNIISLLVPLFILNISTLAQENEKKKEKSEMKTKLDVQTVVKTAFSKKYPDATKVTWEKENGNYEANWGGKSGEDNSVLFTPDGEFIEIVKAIRVGQLPSPVLTYVKEHYKGKKITEAGKVTDAGNKLSYEAEVNGKDIVFDEKGNFVKEEK